MGQHRAAGGLIVAAVHGDIGLADAATLRLG
jgi:heme exporter protein A